MALRISLTAMAALLVGSLCACGGHGRSATPQQVATVFRSQGVPVQVTAVHNWKKGSAGALLHLNDSTLRARHIAGTITGNGIYGFVYDTPDDAAAASPNTHNGEPVHNAGSRKTAGEFFRAGNVVVVATGDPSTLQRVNRAMNSLG